MDNPFNSPVILSYCTGSRGLETGLQWAINSGVRVAAYLEIEAFACWNLVKQMEQGILAPAPIWTDIKTFNPEPFRNKIHGIVGGYPCQPFSVAGERQGENDPRHLWPNIKEHIRTIRPVWCGFENVRNHINIGFRTVKSDLEQMGYRVEAGVYSASEVGAPHKRDRLFILAILANYNGTRNAFGISEQKQRQEREPEITDNSDIRAAEIALGVVQRDNSQCERLERQHGYERNPQGWQEQNRPTPTPNIFPMPRGADQYQWEEPRILESRLGCTINGHNFREDLLRLLGNAVVPQQAELAFRDLIKKF